MKKPSSKMGNVAVDIDAAVLNAGYQPIRTLDETIRHRILLAERDGKKVVIKVAVVAVEQDNLRTEANAHEMLRRLSPRNAPFTFPETETLEDDAVFISVRPFVEHGWFSTTPFRILRKVTDRDLEDVFQVMAFLHRIRENQLTPYFRTQGKVFTLEERLQRHRAYLKPAIGTLCSEKEARDLVAMMKGVGYLRGFAHHDIGPMNMARLPDGRLFINDTEFARWEMKWYDVAYSFLQLSVLHGEEKLAKKWLRFLVRRFKEEMPDEDIETEIFFPLGYWIAANLFMAMQHREQRPRARKMFELILKRDLASLLE